MKFEILQNGKVLEIKELSDGSYKIGRSVECDIRIKSPKISKQHALLVVKQNRAAVMDLGSSNGIFVNGIMVKKHKLSKEDEVVIADYVIRILGSGKSKGHSQSAQHQGSGFGGHNLAHDYNYQQSEPVGLSLSPQERLIQLMDERVLKPFYSLTKMFDWRTILCCVLGLALISSVLLSVFPVLRWGKEITTKESLNRAHTVLNQVVRENYRVLSKTNNDVTRLSVEACESEPGFVKCLILDPRNNAIFAPAKLLNNPVSDVYWMIAIKKITVDKEDIVSIEKEGGTYVVAQPIYIFSAEDNDRVISVIALAEFNTPKGIYSTLEPIIEAILFSVLMSLIAYYLIFKMVTRPVIVMQEQLDAALKGESVTVNCESRFAELETLAQVINFSINRWKQGAGTPGQPINRDDPEVEDSEYLKSIQEFDQATADGLLVLDKDKKVRFVGRILEDLIGLRNQYAIGQNIGDACRDAAFAGTIIELVDKVVQSFGEAQFAQLEINGIPRQMTAIGHKTRSQEVRSILVSVKLSG